MRQSLVWAVESRHGRAHEVIIIICIHADFGAFFCVWPCKAVLVCKAKWPLFEERRWSIVTLNSSVRLLNRQKSSCCYGDEVAILITSACVQNPAWGRTCPLSAMRLLKYHGLLERFSSYCCLSLGVWNVDYRCKCWSKSDLYWCPWMEKQRGILLPSCTRPKQTEATQLIYTHQILVFCFKSISCPQNDSACCLPTWEKLPQISVRC